MKQAGRFSAERLVLQERSLPRNAAAQASSQEEAGMLEVGLAAARTGKHRPVAVCWSRVAPIA
ncbi:MAG: hypothetical protein ACRECC_07610, partial [Pseudolabrys sp.]